MNILILGANSDIAFSIAEIFAKKDKPTLILASRDMEALEKRANDLRIRYNVETQAITFDVTDYQSHPTFYYSLRTKPDIIIVAFGVMNDQHEAQANFRIAKQMIDTNYTGAVSILEVIAADLEQSKMGMIVGISSVAGCRGRLTNYIYGSTKAAFTGYLSGLRARLTRSNVHVLTVLPGFVATKMTSSQYSPAILTARPEKIAKDVYRAVKKKRNLIYTPKYWRLIMGIIKVIPEFIFKRLKI